MILYEDMKPTEHVLFYPMCACKHKLSSYYWTLWSCWGIYHFKKPRFNAILHDLT